MAQDKRPPPGGHGGHSVPSGGPRRGRGKGAGAGRLRRLIPLSRGAILSPVGIGWSEVFLGTGRADGRLLMRPRPRHEDGDLEGAQRFDGHCEGRDGWGAPGAGRVDGGDDGASLPSPETLSPAGGLPARGGGGHRMTRDRRRTSFAKNGGVVVVDPYRVYRIQGVFRSTRWGRSGVGPAARSARPRRGGLGFLWAPGPPRPAALRCPLESRARSGPCLGRG